MEGIMMLMLTLINLGVILSALKIYFLLEEHKNNQDSFIEKFEKFYNDWKKRNR